MDTNNTNPLVILAGERFTASPVYSRDAAAFPIKLVCVRNLAELQDKLRLPGFEQGTRTAIAESPEIIVIDLALDEAIQNICQSLKRTFPSASLLLAVPEEYTIELGQDCGTFGADDIIFMPFRFDEILFRRDYRKKHPSSSDATQENIEFLSIPYVGEAVNGFKITDILSFSRNSVVYKVSGEDGTLYALKLICHPLPGIEDEINASSKITHPNIVKFHSEGSYRSFRYIVTEYVPGANLEEHMLVKGQPDLKSFFHVAKNIASAISAIHAAGMLHRDIKPANIIVSSENGDALISDFGLAMSIASEKKTLDRSSFAEGTPLYMAPEIFRGSQASVKSDIFSFGAAIYHYLCAVPPFIGKGSIADSAENCSVHPKSIRLIRHDIEEELDKFICSFCMAVHPSERPDSMDEVLDKLENLAKICQREHHGQFSANNEHTVLFVDDDPNALETLTVLLRKEPYRCLRASSAQEAIDIIGKEDVNVVVSDYKMPGVNGLELAEKIHESNPAILVIIFSGQTDMASVISAINKGHVYKFLVKSWIREDIRSAILQALSQYELMDSNRKLTATVEAQNKELAGINSRLESIVHERTSELRSATEHLVQYFHGIVESLAGIMEIHSKQLAEHGRRVSEYAVIAGEAMKLPHAKITELKIAGVFHDMGKITLYSGKGSFVSKEEESKLLAHHPMIGSKILAGIPDFQNISQAVRYHHERFDGKGYPEGLVGRAIPLEARIVAGANALDNIINPPDMDVHYRKRAFVEAELKKLAGNQLDPEIVQLFMEHVIPKIYEDKSPYKSVLIKDLQPGMVVASELILKDGEYIITALTHLTKELIIKISKDERMIKAGSVHILNKPRN